MSLWLSIFPVSVAMAETFAFNTQKPGMETQKPFLTSYAGSSKVYFEPQKLKNDNCSAVAFLPWSCKLRQPENIYPWSWGETSRIASWITQQKILYLSPAFMCPSLQVLESPAFSASPSTDDLNTQTLAPTVSVFVARVGKGWHPSASRHVQVRPARACCSSGHWEDRTHIHLGTCLPMSSSHATEAPSPLCLITALHRCFHTKK